MTVERVTEEHVTEVQAERGVPRRRREDASVRDVIEVRHDAGPREAGAAAREPLARHTEPNPSPPLCGAPRTKGHSASPRVTCIRCGETIDTESSMTCAGAGLSHAVTVTPPKRCSLPFRQPSISLACSPWIDTSKARGKRVSSARASRSTVATSAPNVSRPIGSAQRGLKSTRSSGLACATTYARAAFQSASGTTECVSITWAPSSSKPAAGTTANAHRWATCHGFSSRPFKARGAYTPPCTSSRPLLRVPSPRAFVS